MTANYNEWSHENIEDRQKKLADIAVEVWNLTI